MRKKRSWAINLGSIKGIKVRIHLTFPLILLWVALESSNQGANPLPEILFVITLFACVLLHELGHALMAQRFKVRTRDIILYPFGGVAALMDEAKPKAEFFITLAGPAVNFAIAVLLYSFIDFNAWESGNTTFVSRVFIANLVLLIFNMIPAFPMDGGRLLRSGLALCNVSSATIIAARVGQLLSLMLAAFAVYYGLVILLIIAAIVFSNATQEIARDRAIKTFLHEGAN